MNGHVASYDLSKLTVLIVEKQRPMRALLRQMLRAFGISRIDDADTPEKGWEQFNHHAPDLVLVDWCPEFDGLGLVRRIRADSDSCYPQAPIIMVSAFGEANRVCEAADAGMNEYLVKPVSPSLLYTRIVAAIEHARPFVRARNYTGPCRRRHKLPFAGSDRRQTDAETDAAAAMSGKSDPVAPAANAPSPAKAA